MKTPSLSTRPASVLIIITAVFLLYATAPHDVWGFPTGIYWFSGNPATNGGLICTDCHSGGALPTVTITGPTSLASGASGTYTLTITGGAASYGGLDVSASAGTLTASDANTQLLRGEITQTFPTAFSGGTLSFGFTLTAPLSGQVILYGAGLSANGDGGAGGDYAAKAALTVTVTVNNPPTVPQLVSPANGQTGVASPVTLAWQPSTDPDGDAVNYHVYCCTDSTFATCTPVTVAMQRKTEIYLAFSGLLLAGFAVRKGARGKAMLLILVATLLFSTGIIITACGSSRSATPPAPPSNVTSQVSGLSSGSTYYWKVVADDGKGGLATSPTWSFSAN